MAQGLARSSNMENIREEVQHVCIETSDRLNPETSRKSVQANILLSMIRFNNVVRWKEFWRDQKQSTKTELNGLNEEAEESRFMAAGLNTGLNPTFHLNIENHGSENLEGFLTVVENPPQGGFLTQTLRTLEQ